MTPFDLYHDLAARLLGREDFPLPLPECDRNYPHNIGLLSDAEESALAASVLNHTRGLSLEDWRALDMEQRLPWMRFAVDKSGLGANGGQPDRASILLSLGDRIRADSPVIDADEVSTWPDGLVEEFVADGTLISIEAAKSIACDACGHDHVESVEYIKSPSASELRAYISCPTVGRVLVPFVRLRRWAIDPQKFQSPAELESVSPAGDEPLADRAQLVLIAMLELDAVDSDRRKPTDEIAIKALGEGTDPNALKGVMSDLKTRELINSKTGRGGGCWLTDKGNSRASKLRDH
ncbi:Rrf2 family transcriptional regulator [Bremerella volcania]|nr:Rrf2 family transcriptional regulator [Bremerella volcania]